MPTRILMDKTAHRIQRSSVDRQKLARTKKTNLDCSIYTGTSQNWAGSDFVVLLLSTSACPSGSLFGNQPSIPKQWLLLSALACPGGSEFGNRSTNYEPSLLMTRLSYSPNVPMNAPNWNTAFISWTTAKLLRKQSATCCGESSNPQPRTR